MKKETKLTADENGRKITLHEELICDFLKWLPKNFTDVNKSGLHFQDKDEMISSDIMVACDFLKQWKPKFNKTLSQQTVEKKSRCCGRCDGVNDECIADQICIKHSIQGCRACWPEPK